MYAQLYGPVVRRVCAFAFPDTSTDADIFWDQVGLRCRYHGVKMRRSAILRQPLYLQTLNTYARAALFLDDGDTDPTLEALSTAYFHDMANDDDDYEDEDYVLAVLAASLRHSSPKTTTMTTTKDDFTESEVRGIILKKTEQLAFGHGRHAISGRRSSMLKTWSYAGVKAASLGHRRPLIQAYARRTAALAASRGGSSMYRDVKAGINYAGLVAWQDSCKGLVATLDKTALFRYAHRFQRETTEALRRLKDDDGRDGVLIDVDLLHINTMVEKRLRSAARMIAVNRAGCLCRVKCVLRTDPVAEAALWHAFTVSSSVKVCRACELPCWLDATITDKGRDVISTAQRTACSADGCTQFKVVALVPTNVSTSSTGRLRYSYKHSMLCTNGPSVAGAARVDDLSGAAEADVEAELRNSAYKGSRSRAYCVCFGGRRTCFTRMTLTVPKTSSSFADILIKNRRDEASGATTTKQCRRFGSEKVTCGACLSNKAPKEITCLDKYAEAPLGIEIRLCKGCCLASFCYHRDKWVNDHALSKNRFRLAASLLATRMAAHKTLMAADGWQTVRYKGRFPRGA